MPGSDTLTRGVPPPPEAAPPLEIRLFGPMEVCVCGGPLPRLRSRKGLWLLALLALRGGRGVERDWVAGTLWPDSDGADARRSLRQSLHDLRLALGPEAGRLGSDEPRTMRLDVGGAAVDVLAFDAALGRGDPASLADAVRLYRGPLLEDCAEEWGLEERRRREQEYVTALERLAAAAAAQKEYAAAAGYLRPIVGLDPYREDSQRALMHALAGGGNPAGALLVYRRFREFLRREMATEPADETTALFRRLRAEAHERPTPGAPPPPLPLTTPLPHSPTRPFPHALTPLIGRGEAVREVVTRLAHAPLVTLTGAGGVGKTRLALGVAEALADEYPDGARFVPLAALAAPEAVPETVLTALGAGRGESALPAVEILQQFLASRRLLIVLDNCEHLLDACASLADALLCCCPGLRVLATSRQPLGLHGEAVWRVPSLALPPAAAWPDGVGPGDYAAVRLFVERARAAEAGFALTPHNAPAVVAICRRLDGIPLAIELAAARVRSLSPEDISARLGDGFGLLTGGGRTLLPRQQTLAATFDWGWDLLSAPERALLGRLSVFAGGWTLAAAEAVCADGGAAPCPIRGGDVVDLLTALVDKSLVVYRPDGGGGEARYSLLETVRQYAGERLQESGDGDAARDRHRDFCVAWAERVKRELVGPEQSLWLDRLEREHDNLRAAMAWCERGPESSAEAGLLLARALWRFWYVRGYLSEGRQWLDRMLARDAGAAPSARSKALTAAGNLAQIQGDYGPARAYYEECLAIQRRLGDQTEIANVCNNLGNLVSDQGDYAGASALYEESLRIQRRLGHGHGTADALGNLGLMAYEQGDYAGARPFWEESLALERGLGNPGGIATSVGSLGMLAEAEGRYAEAHGLYEECLALYRQLGDHHSTTQALINQANLACRRGDLAGARPLYVESLVMSQKLGNLPTIAHGLEGLAATAQGQGDDQALRAARVLGAAQALRERIGSPLSPVKERERDAVGAALRESLGATEFDAALAVGRAMGWEEAFRCAQDGAPRSEA